MKSTIEKTCNSSEIWTQDFEMWPWLLFSETVQSGASLPTIRQYLMHPSSEKRKHRNYVEKTCKLDSLFMSKTFIDYEKYELKRLVT
jgi:hypothetical protein